VKRSATPASRAAAIVADTGGLLKALACDERGRPSWPSFAELLSASRRILVLAEIDSFLTTDLRDFTAVRIGPKYDRALRLVP
jgi:hypothetical protein